MTNEAANLSLIWGNDTLEDIHRMEGSGMNCSRLYNLFNGYRYYFKSQPQLGALITALYVLVLTIGAVGNCLVMLAVVRNPAMRTPRNFFIVNLALSDFMLCTLTVPFNMRLVLYTFWSLGNISCKLVASAQGVNIFVSTMSLTAIALDRYLVILFPTRRTHQNTLILISFSSVWCLSVLLASPVFFVTNSHESLRDRHGGIDYTIDIERCGMYEFYMCKEDANSWNHLFIGRETYTILCFVLQYFLPLFALTFVYARIGSRMQARLRHGPGATSTCEDRRRSVANRQRRTNILLVSLVATFSMAWLPLNIYNTLIFFGGAGFKLYVFTLCHIAGMMSAATNPVLYGVFNDNFRTEFINIFHRVGLIGCIRKLKNVCKRGDRSRRGVFETTNTNTKSAFPIQPEQTSLLGGRTRRANPANSAVQHRNGSASAAATFAPTENLIKSASGLSKASSKSVNSSYRETML